MAPKTRLAGFSNATGHETNRRGGVVVAPEPRNFGLWLAGRAAIPFRDLVPDEAARQAELTKLTDALAATGKFGRWLARRLR